MSYVVRHPSGQYVSEALNTDTKQVSIALVPKGKRSAWARLHEAKKVAERIPGATVEVR